MHHAAILLLSALSRRPSASVVGASPSLASSRRCTPPCRSRSSTSRLPSLFVAAAAGPPMTTKRRRRPSRSRASASAASGPTSKRPAPDNSKRYTRPGVEAAVRLASLRPIRDHVDAWERASGRYPDAIEAKGGTKLSKLDRRREELAEGWSRDGSSPATMTKEQLLDVVIEWKFGKGKPRHALKPLLESNSDAAVADAAGRAFEAADAVRENDAKRGERDEETMSAAIKSAINCLCELKGVGPATASAVLCLHSPERFAFMDDEVIECLYDGKRGYTLKIYAEVNDRCREIAAELNEAGTGGEGGDASSEWTPCRVGKALWTAATLSAVGDESGLSAIFGDDP